MDTETTGLSPRGGHRVVAISLVEVLDGSRIGDHLGFLLDPERRIPREASEVHGIRSADVKGKPRFKDVSAEIAKFIGPSSLIGYNLAFDLEFLEDEFARCGGELRSATGVDVMSLCMAARGGQRLKLHLACKAVGIETEGLKAHTAHHDAVATGLLYLKLRSMVESHRWAHLVAESTVTASKAREERRYYDNDDLQSAFELFEGKQYDEALALALKVVETDEREPSNDPDALAYELAAMILRRRTRLQAERDLLCRYLARRLRHEATDPEVLALAVPPLGVNVHPLVIEEVSRRVLVPNRRPTPELWQMAQRLARVTERLRAQPVPLRVRSDNP